MKMKVFKKICKVILAIILTIVLVGSLAAVIALNYKTVLASHKIKDVVNSAKTFDDIEISDSVKIVGVGEATHGSSEFQTLKLEMLKKLVEENGFTAFALEADFADCLEANEFIQGGEGNARDIVNNMSFKIYHTAEMARILDWMREYNLSVPKEKSLRFYGFDMQNPEKGVDFLKNYMEENGITGIDTTSLDYFVDEERTEQITKEDAEKIKAELSEIRKAVETKDVIAAKVTENIESTVDYVFAEGMDMYGYRDKAMADNVTWILEREKKVGSGKVMLAAHDGHISKAPHSSMMPTTMGHILKEKYGDEYYSLGTDFFKGKANISVLSITTEEYQRKDYYVTTADPIAYQAKYMKDKKFYLDFETISPETDKKVYDLVHSPVSMGTVGEGFTGIYYIYHSAYRTEMAPVDLYDGMIFYYQVHATVPQY
ncbi:erythromycin esterase family protein [Butyrivibrio hungatei]|nr:erythromycin esterase family protein [Butyrivibrio hungatei]